VGGVLGFIGVFLLVFVGFSGCLAVVGVFYGFWCWFFRVLNAVLWWGWCIFCRVCEWFDAEVSSLEKTDQTV
jgi:hypothetical protein